MNNREKKAVTRIVTEGDVEKALVKGKLVGEVRFIGGLYRWRTLAGKTGDEESRVEAFANMGVTDKRVDPPELPPSPPLMEGWFD